MPIAFTSGEPSGIGPDIALIHAQRDRKESLLVYCDPDVLMNRAKQLNLPIKLKEQETIKASELCIFPIKTNTKVEAGILNTKIKKVAVLGGSGSFAIDAAKSSGAQAFITSDLKYHDFFKAENKLLLIDIGHYESEQHIKNILVAYLKKKITNFAIVLSTINTNPVKYT